VYITSLGKVPKFVPQMQGAKGVFKQIPLSKADGVPNFSFRVFTLEPGGNTPYHKHDFEHLNYIIAGGGVLIGEGKENPIQQGDFALVPPGELHQFKNTSPNQALILICAVPKEYE
jgi:quercetin dioxygenase-like cupin family protein